MVSSEADLDSSRASPSRAGERVLAILSTPLNFRVLEALHDRPMRLAELRRVTGLPAQTTLRGHLASLGEFGAVGKRPTARMPYAVENELTPMGCEMLAVASHLDGWLGEAPDGPIRLETGSARGTVKAFVDGWGASMIRALAAHPMSLTELDREIPEVSYPALERRLASLRMAGLVAAQPVLGSGTPYAVTDWARRAILPLAAASSCERAHLRGQAAPVTQTDIEAAFMLAIPLVDLPPDVDGCCQLAVEAEPGDSREEAGVQVEVERGQVISCDSDLRAESSDYAVGSAARWFGAIVDGTVDQLRFGGARLLPEAIVSGLHAALVSR